MIDSILGLAPQFTTALIVCVGWFGNSEIKSGSKRVARFFSDGGNHSIAIEKASTALAHGVLSITTFMTAFLVSTIDTVVSAVLADGSTSQISIFILGYVILITVFVRIILGKPIHEIAIAFVRVPLSGIPPKQLKITGSQAIDRLTFILLAISVIAAISFKF